MHVIDEQQLEMKKGVKRKVTCRLNHFGKLGPPWTLCWRMESNGFNVGYPLHFKYILSNMLKYGWTSSMFMYM
jgi:hypothetical protein